MHYADLCVVRLQQTRSVYFPYLIYFMGLLSPFGAAQYFITSMSNCLSKPLKLEWNEQSFNENGFANNKPKKEKEKEKRI